MGCRAIATVLFATLWLVAAGSASEAEKEAKPAEASGTQPEVLAFDGFDGKLALKWEPVRPDPSHVSLTKHPGKLTIVTQRGSIHGDEKHDELGAGIQAKNIYVIRNPLAKGEDFVIATCIESFHPKTHYQQAHLVVYDDDDNYLKWGIEWSSEFTSGRCFVFLRETSQKSSFQWSEANPPTERVWLRIIKRGKSYEHLYSYDGRQYTAVGEKTWGSGTPKWVGILAKNGGNPEADDIAACFDFFELRRLTAAEKNDPLHLDVQRLQGTWKVRSCRISGKVLAESTLSRFVFGEDGLTAREGSEALKSEYKLDVSKKPKQLVLSSLFGQPGRSVRAIYSLEGDKLLICFDPRPGAATPDKLETKEGDDRWLVTLEREKEAEKTR